LVKNGGFQAKGALLFAALTSRGGVRFARGQRGVSTGFAAFIVVDANKQGWRSRLFASLRSSA
jgi:hypothetical protein